MYLNVDIDEMEIQHRVRRYLYTQLTSRHLKEGVIENVNIQVAKAVNELIKEQFDLEELLIKGVVRYLEKYRVTDIVSMFKTKYIPKVTK